VKVTMLVVALIIQTINLAAASKILGLFPHPGISHFNVFRPIMLQLASLGHEVEVASYFPNEKPVDHYKDLVFEGQTILTGSTDLKVKQKTFRISFENLISKYSIAEICQKKVS
jgi:glucuronosyltransferase